MSLDPKWIAGFYDACGRLLLISNRLNIEFRTNNFKVAWHFTHELPLDHSHWAHEYHPRGREYMIHVSDEPSLTKILEAVKAHSSINQNAADVGFFILQRQDQYKTDVKTRLIFDQIKDKLSWEVYNEPELPPRPSTSHQEQTAVSSEDSSE